MSKFIDLSLFGLVLLASVTACSITPRVITNDENLIIGNHVIANFLRSDLNFDSNELTKLMRQEFFGRKRKESEDYMIEIGGTCIVEPRFSTCVYNHESSYEMSRPWSGSRQPAAIIKGIATKILTIRASIGFSSTSESIVSVQARIMHTAGANSIELK